MSQLPEPTWVNFRSGGALGVRQASLRLHHFALDPSPLGFSVKMFSRMLEVRWKEESQLEMLLASLLGLWRELRYTLWPYYIDDIPTLEDVRLLRSYNEPVRKVIAAYTKMAREAKAQRLPGDPWPLLIVDDANGLSDDDEWKYKNDRLELLQFFLNVTQKEQLAHGEPPAPPRPAAVLMMVSDLAPCSDPRLERHPIPAVAGQERCAHTHLCCGQRSSHHSFGCPQGPSRR